MEIIFGLLIIIILAVTAWFSPPLVATWLAENNILYTTVKETTVKAIVRGRALDHFVMAFADYHLNDPRKPWFDHEQPDWEVLYHGKTATSPGEPDAKYDDRTQFQKSLGVYWVGWPWALRVYEYEFEWNETKAESGTGFERVYPRKEWTDFAFVSDFTYAIPTEGAETQDRLETNELTLATVAICNPYRALFSAEDWMRRITAEINRRARAYIGGKTYQDLLASDQDATMSAYSDPLLDLNAKLPEDYREGAPEPHGLIGRCGVILRAANLETIELSGAERARNAEAAALEYNARQEAKATEIKAAATAAAEIAVGNARAQVIEMVGKKEAESLKMRLEVIDTHGENGMELARMDGLTESSKGPGTMIIWANDPFSTLAKALKPKGGE